MMSEIPEELLYTPSHEWIRVEDNEITVGITQHAQALLGDLVFVDLPTADTECQAGDDIAVVESVKAASDVYSPVSGQIMEVNEMLSESPELVNQDPFGQGWLFRIKMDDPEELDDLLNASAYAKQIAAEEE